MPPTWPEYRKVIQRNGFQFARSRKHETWVQLDDNGRLIRHTRVAHGNDEIADPALFHNLLKQCGKTKKHFYEVLQSKKSAASGTGN